ncbi:nucleoporin NUP159 [Aplysia californica]|uniref:Nucleoporin NUP159 n=1 Tax=Aplysia californica TaxID=6500 RepID=A0ABM0KAW0_APLCA|nr:nucleoporin NUP159 [Aplysia californica]
MNNGATDRPHSVSRVETVAHVASPPRHNGPDDLRSGLDDASGSSINNSNSNSRSNNILTTFTATTTATITTSTSSSSSNNNNSNGFGVVTAELGAQSPRLVSDHDRGRMSRSLLMGSPVTSLRVNGSVEGESDTDSLDTPAGSPAKGRRLTRNPSVESALQSFGLHSPDMLPGADVDFRDLGDNVKVTGEGTVEAFNSVYTNRALGGQRIYYDPDIIDLTNFPPPETPDDDAMLDFTALSTFPPPVFSSNSSLASLGHDSDPLTMMTTPTVRPSVTPARLERSASTGQCPDFLDEDIDALIAQFTIPPPPPSSHSPAHYNGGGADTHTTPTTHGFSQSFSGAFPSSLTSGDQLDVSSSRDVTSSGGSVSDVSRQFVDEELSRLIIPPPPSSAAASPSTEDIPSACVGQGAQGTTARDASPSQTSPVSASAATHKPSYRHHKRSSSLDIPSVRSAVESLANSAKSKSFDKKAESGVGDSPPSPTTTSPHPASSVAGSAAGSNGSVDELTGDSPAAVSEKLHSLLQSLPNFAPELSRYDSDQNFVRTGSLRIYRSSSLDLSPAPTNLVPDPSSNQTVAAASTGSMPNSNSVPIFSRSSSLRLKKPWHRSRSQSYDQQGLALLSGRSNSEILSDASHRTASGKSGSGSGKSSEKSSSGGSESFASLKAKLKDYRDLLLNRNKSSSSSRKYATTGDESGSESAGKSSLRRSGSFSKLVSSPFSRRGSKTDAEGTGSITSADSNWELKEAKTPAVVAPPGGELDAGGEKRVPAVRDSLATNRPGLRPLSSNNVNQPEGEEEKKGEEEEKEEEEKEKEEEEEEESKQAETHEEEE